MCEICLKLETKTPEQDGELRYGVFISDFEHAGRVDILILIVLHIASLQSFIFIFMFIDCFFGFMLITSTYWIVSS